MSWEEHFDREGGINAPVTIVDRGGGEGCRPGPTISLEAYSDYIIKKALQNNNWREEEWGGPPPGGFPPWSSGGNGFGPNMQFGATKQNADYPLKVIGGVYNDSMFLLTLGLVCPVSDAAAGTITITVTYADPTTGNQTVTLTLSLAAIGENHSSTTAIFVLQGSQVTVAVTNAGTYGAAKYDAFAGLVRIG